MTEPETAAAGGRGGGRGDTRPVATGAPEPDEPFEIRGALSEAKALLMETQTTISTSSALSASITQWFVKHTM